MITTVDVEAFRLRRLDAGLSQRQLAAKAGVSNTTVANIEAGKGVYPSTLKSICDAMNCKPSDVVKH